MLHLAFGERALLADEVGLGKTVWAIAAFIHKLDGTHFAVDGLKLPTDAAQESSGTFDTLKRKRDKFRKKAAALMKEHNRRDRRLAKGKTEVTGETLTPAEKLIAKAAKIDAFLSENQPRADANYHSE